MMRIKKINAKGFAHQVALMAVVVVVAIGAIGSYIYLKSSSAATCYGVYLDLRSQGVNHSPCWSTPGAYLVNFGAGKTGDGIDHVAWDNNGTQSERMDYPNYIIVVSGGWKVCDDIKFQPDSCAGPIFKGAINLCNQLTLGVAGGPYKFCAHPSVYMQEAKQVN